MSSSQRITSLTGFVQEYIVPARTFMKKCVKPSKKELGKLLKSHAMGIGLLGALGYIIRLIHIPINNIIVSKPDK